MIVGERISVEQAIKSAAGSVIGEAGSLSWVQSEGAGRETCDHFRLPVDGFALH